MRGGGRWGSREVEIVKVQLLDRSGRHSSWFVSGEPLTVRVHYQTKNRIDSPVFGIALYSSGGTHIAGPNTRTSNFSITQIEGDGWVDYAVEALPLLAGTYDLSVAIYDYACAHAYDHHHRLHSLEVRRGSVAEHNGLVHIPCRWQHCTGSSVPQSPGRPHSGQLEQRAPLQ
jgi:lipopolysaccharide transport system ATP-binding protein